MDLDILMEEIEKVRKNATEIQELLGLVRQGAIMGENLTEGQKTALRTKGLNKLQDLENALVAFKEEVGI